MTGTWKMKLTKEEKEAIAEIALAFEGKTMRGEDYEVAAGTLASKFCNLWPDAKIRRAFSIVRTEYKIKPGRGGSWGTPPKRKKTPSSLQEEINVVVAYFVNKLIKVVENYHKQDGQKVKELEAKIAELKADLRELKDVRQAVENYQRKR